MHELWMARGRSFLAGKPIDFPPEFAERDDMCPIGNWLRDRIDPELRNRELYDRTCALHDAFHLALGRLFREDITQVSGAARLEFQRKGDDLTAAIEEWVSLGRTAETLA